jgi:nucleoside-diphosphate-sugar epimerase
MKVLVLGGTGAMGKHLVEILAESGFETVVTSRKARQSQKNILYIQGNALDLKFLRGVLATDWDAIIDFMVYSTKTLNERLDILMKSTKQYIFLSSARVYADSESLLTEESPRLLDVCTDTRYIKTDEYALAKAREEDILKNSKYANWTIIRPYITYSENRLQLGDLEKENWLYRALHHRTIVFSKDIASKLTTLTYGFDVANSICKIIGEKKALSEIFHITAPDAYTWRDILEAYLKVIDQKIGCKPNVLILENTPFKHKYQVKFDRIYNREFDNRKIYEFIYKDDFVPTLSGIEKCMQSFLDHPEFLPIDWKKEAYFDRLSKNKTPLKEISLLKDKIMYLFIRYVLSYTLFYKLNQKIKFYGK